MNDDYKVFRPRPDELFKVIVVGGSPLMLALFLASATRNPEKSMGILLIILFVAIGLGLPFVWAAVSTLLITTEEGIVRRTPVSKTTIPWKSIRAIESPDGQAVSILVTAPYEVTSILPWVRSGKEGSRTILVTEFIGEWPADPLALEFKRHRPDLPISDALLARRVEPFWTSHITIVMATILNFYVFGLFAIYFAPPGRSSAITEFVTFSWFGATLAIGAYLLMMTVGKSLQTVSRSFWQTAVYLAAPLFAAGVGGLIGWAYEALGGELPAVRTAPRSLLSTSALVVGVLVVPILYMALRSGVSIVRRSSGNTRRTP